MLELTRKYPARRAFITGAGSGIGAAFALSLAADGWTVGIAEINPVGLEDSAAAVEAAGGKPVALPLDVTDAAAVGAAIDGFVVAQGGIDLLINNAGIGSGGAMGEFTLEDWHRTLDVNLWGVIHGLHFGVPHLKRAGSGYILNVGSAASFTAAPTMSAYNASKSAVLAISETLRAELYPYGIGVSCLMPTFINTPLHERMIGTPEGIRMGKKLVQKATAGPQELVEYALREMGQGRFYLHYPPDSRKLWDFKRLFPERYFRRTVEFMQQRARKRQS